MIDPDLLYAILRQAAMNGEIISYAELSRRYEARTGESHDPHGTWDAPLGAVNGRTLAAGKRPPISAVVTYAIDPRSEEQQFGPPGNSFWGSPGVPAKPAKKKDCKETWMRLVGLVHRERWPETL